MNGRQRPGGLDGTVEGSFTLYALNVIGNNIGDIKINKIYPNTILRLLIRTIT